MEFLIGAIVVGVIWFFVSANGKVKAHQAFNALDAAESWIIDQGINISSVRFSAYSEQELAINPGATILAAEGKRSTGEAVGFVIEVLPGRGVVQSEYIEPHGIISYHKLVAQTAKLQGNSLIGAFQQRASEHRAKYRERWPNG